MNKEEAYETVLKDKVEQAALAFVSEYGVSYEEAVQVAQGIVAGLTAEKTLEEWELRG